MSETIGKNIKRVRMGAKLTQLIVAQKANISLAALGKIENGRSNPRFETLRAISKVLQVDIAELITPVREIECVRFRAKKTLKKRDNVLAAVSKWLDDFNFLIEKVGGSAGGRYSDIVESVHSVLDDPIQLAARTRDAMGLSAEEPIHDIAGLFAKYSIKLLALPLTTDSFFGLSVGERDGGPAIVVNAWSRITFEKQIFSTAHELGHLLMHLDSFDVQEVSDAKTEESEADIFASHFLMPHRKFVKEWNESSGLSFLDRILKVKRIFHVSYMTIVRRLQDCEAMGKDQQTYQRLNGLLRSHYNQRITRKFEPEPLVSYDFKTDWLEFLVRSGLEKGFVSQSRAAEILNHPLEKMREITNSWMEEEGGKLELGSVHC